MSNIFHTQFDLELLADKLAPLLEDRFTRHEHAPERGRADRAAPDDWPDESSEADPWGSDEPRQENRSAGRSESSGSSSRSSGNRSSSGRGGSQRSSQGGADSRRSTSRSSGGRSSGSNKTYDFPTDGQHEDRVGKLWEFGLSDAPVCDGNSAHEPLPAAEVTKPRAQWRAWACPLGFGRDYKDKCEYWEYEN